MAPVGSRESLAAAIQAEPLRVLRYRTAQHAVALGPITSTSRTCADCRHVQRARHQDVSHREHNHLWRGHQRRCTRLWTLPKKADITAIIARRRGGDDVLQPRGVEVHLSHSSTYPTSGAEVLRPVCRRGGAGTRRTQHGPGGGVYRQIVEQNVCGPRGQLVRIEMFCHGALCMAISGKCYMSLHNANRSANHGRMCVQICRRSYTVTDNRTGNQLEIDNKYIAGPKDLKTVRFIDRMMKSGVRVFKIEGRARGAEYVYTV